MMYTNSFDECYNLSLTIRIYTDSNCVYADYTNAPRQLIETFKTEKQAIDFIHWIAQESK